MKINDTISGKTIVVGLIGNPIEHSFSPMLHNTISSILGIDLVYVPFKVEKDFLQDAVKGLKALNALGFNVTVPYKKEIMKFTDDNIRETFLMGAINTIKNIDGRLYGYNTDGEGFLRAFKEETGMNFKDKKVILIGAGGVARSIAVKIALEGAKKISIINRTHSKAEDIAEIINSNIKEIAKAYSVSDKEFEDVFKESEIVINTTSVGMKGISDNSPLDQFNYFAKDQVAYDVVYNPIATKFLSQASEKGCKAAGGLKMLFYQGIYTYEIWTGVKLEDEFLKTLYKDFKNYILNDK